ncbi:MAG: hypothetical protein JEY91_17810 [Spirochaetaceae bacterium]|nr:hypothetical protein [Spirochaetaceae bacterium]
MNQKGEILYHKNITTERLTSLSVIDPYREDLVVAVKCVFTRSAVYSLLGMHPAWYWLADPFMKENINFVLGRALYTKPMFHFSAEELFLYPLSL